MSLYYQDDFVTLYHGDCLTEHREWLAADVLVTDPPYGRAWKQGEIRGRRASAGFAGIANDETTAVRDAALLAWGDDPATVFGDLMLAPPSGTKLTAIYQKPPDAGIRGAIAGVRRDAEAIYFLGAWAAGLGGTSSVFKTAAPCVGNPSGIAARAGHPNAKPLDIMERLIGMSEGVIADPFSGSGSTLVAAKALGRKVIGVELKEKYCEIIAKRCAQDVLDFGGVA
jgi:site-specific DNA-methyltransferase (adenine-specific)